MKKRLLSMLMAVCLLAGLLPTVALAEEAVTFTAIEGTAGANENETYSKLVDGETGTKWCVTGSEDGFDGAYVIFKASAPMTVTGYSITTGNDNVANPGRNPESWTLYGCNDYDKATKTGNWVPIHSVTDDTVLKDEDLTTYNYYLTETAQEYQYFKLVISAIESGSVMQMSEFTLTSCVHEWGTPETTAPTCTTKGYTTSVCSLCHNTKIANETSPLGHDFSDEGGACTRCGKTKAELYTFDVSKGRVIIADDEHSGKLLVYYFTQEDGFKKAEGYIDPSETITVTGSTNVNELHVTATTQVKIKAENLRIDRSGTDYAYAMSLDASGANVTLILEGENSFAGGRNRAGISVCEGTTLTIEGDGSLVAKGGLVAAGIGGGYGGAGGTITINSGTVTATGGLYAAAIGGGYGGAGGSVTINGGTVNAKSDYGAGIGSGKGSSGDSTVTISGGIVNAESDYGAGIGSGKGSSGDSTVTISGGTVNAQSTHGASSGSGDESFDAIYGIGSDNVSGDKRYFDNPGSDNVSGGTDHTSTGIFANSVTVEGGSVTATGGDAQNGSYGIFADGNLLVNGGSVTATGNDAGTMSCGILAGNVTVSGGSVEAKGSNAMVSYGICTHGQDGGLGKMTISGNADVTATGGNGETVSYGIYADSDLTITGGTVTAIGGNGETVSYGIYADRNLTIDGGTVTATGGDAETLSCGIYTIGNITIEGATLNATGGTAGTLSYGIAVNTLTIKGGTVTATGDDAGTLSYGIAFNTLTIIGGHLTARTLAGTGGGKAALSKEPVLDAYNNYYWRTDAAESFTASSETEQYQYNPADTYVEFSNGNTYTITLDANYAGGTPSAVVTGPEGKLTTETLPTPTRDGYIFAGWYMADGTEVTSDTVFTKDTTIYAHWTAIPIVGVSTYAITVESADNGDVTSSHKTASKGTTVTLTVEPDKGYTLETLTVTDGSGNEIELTNKGDGKYTFTMPGSKVTVTVTFMEDNSMLNFFVDVPADAYYYDAVLWAAVNDITGGIDDTHFAPNAPCTRGQAVTFLWRAAGCPAPRSSAMPFTDVKEGAYYYDAVLWAVENGITNGTSDTTFSPDAACSRGQIVTFLWRSQNSPAAAGENSFTDVAADSYCADAVLWAVENGITEGTTDTTFSPNNDCTRAQIVTFLFRCLGGE